MDVHTHFMPPNVLAKVWAFFDSGRAAAGQDWPIVYRRPEAERLALLRAFGVRRFSALLYPHKPGMAAWLNTWAAGFAARTPDALHSATFFPEQEVAAATWPGDRRGAPACSRHTCRSVGTTRGIRGWTGCGACWPRRARGSSSTAARSTAPRPYTGPGPISGVLARHPRLTVIIAHLGAPEYGEFLDLARRYPGVHLDTTMAFTDFLERLAPFPAALRPRLAAAADHILPGRRLPDIPTNTAIACKAWLRSNSGPEWLRAVCYDNAARLLGL